MVILWYLLYSILALLGLFLIISLLPIYAIFYKSEYDSDEYYSVYSYLSSNFFCVKYFHSLKKYEIIFLNRFHKDIGNSEEDIFSDEVETVTALPVNGVNKESVIPKVTPDDIADKIVTPEIIKDEIIDTDLPKESEPVLEKNAENKKKKTSHRKKWGERWARVKKVYRLIKKQKKTFRKSLRWGKNSLISVFKIIKFSGIDFEARFGFEDPAETGKIYGYLLSFINGVDLNGMHGINLKLNPVFENIDVFNFKGNLKLKTSLFAFFIWGLKLVITFPYLQAFFTCRDYKKYQA